MILFYLLFVFVFSVTDLHWQGEMMLLFPNLWSDFLQFYTDASFQLRLALSPIFKCSRCWIQVIEYLPGHNFFLLQIEFWRVLVWDERHFRNFCSFKASLLFRSRPALISLMSSPLLLLHFHMNTLLHCS